MNAFGQEFYPLESIIALQTAYDAHLTDRDTLLELLAAQLPQKSAGTRLRIAAKFTQRYLTGNGDELSPSPEKQPFVRLVALLKHQPTQIELLFWQLSKVDTVVGALARELFYPVCVAGRPPDGYGAVEFAAVNGGQLFASLPLLTRSFIIDYAAAHWNFHNTATIDRSLRVMQVAGLIERDRMFDLRGHPAAYPFVPHDVSLITFIWALYDEFLPHAPETGLVLSADVLPVADFARTLLLSREQVAAHIEAAHKHGLISYDGAASGHKLRLVFSSLDDLTEKLLALTPGR